MTGNYKNGLQTPGGGGGDGRQAPSQVSKAKRVLGAGSTEDLFLALQFAPAPPHATGSNTPLGCPSSITEGVPSWEVPQPRTMKSGCSH